MSTNPFDDFVKEQKALKEEQDKQEPFDADKEISQWQSDLKNLYEKVTEYLAEYVKDGTVTLRYRDTFLSEESLGTYPVSELHITIGTKEVSLLPIGTLLIGSRGRVDMKGDRGTIKIVMVDKRASGMKFTVTYVNPNEPKKTEQKSEPIEWEWKISTKPPQVKYLELSKSQFLEALLEVANG